jgi:hypothetical protein
VSVSIETSIVVHRDCVYKVYHSYKLIVQYLWNKL